MVTRGSKQLSSTLQELRVTRTSSRISRPQAEDEQQTSPNHQARDAPPPSTNFPKSHVMEKGLLQPLVMQFSVILQVSNKCMTNFVDHDVLKIVTCIKH